MMDGKSQPWRDRFLANRNINLIVANVLVLVLLVRPSGVLGESLGRSRA